MGGCRGSGCMVNLFRLYIIPVGASRQGLEEGRLSGDGSGVSVGANRLADTWRSSAAGVMLLCRLSLATMQCQSLRTSQCGAPMTTHAQHTWTHRWAS